jgi:hypothetical protein
VLGRAVGLDRQPKRRPGDRRADPHERLAAHASWRRGTRASAGGLFEAHPAVADLGLDLDRRQRDGSHAQLLRADLDPRHAEVAGPEMSGIRDRAVVCHLDVRPQLVGLTERIGFAHRIEVLDHVRRRVVVVGDAHRERDLREPLDGFGRNPGDCGDG